MPFARSAAGAPVRRSRVAGGLVMAGLVVAVTGCTGSGDPADLRDRGPDVAPDVAPDAVPSAPPTPTATVPPSVAAVSAADLPTGPAVGELVLTLHGLGELRSEVDGECRQGAGGTEVQLTGGTTAVTVLLSRGGPSTLDVHDAAVESQVALEPGEFIVDGSELMVLTTLGGPAGTEAGVLHLRVDCG